MKMNKTILKERLSKRIGEQEIEGLIVHITENKNALSDVYDFMYDSDKRISDNAAWILTHLPKTERHWLDKKQQELIDETLITTSTTKRRLLLTMLEQQTFKAEEIRTDFLNFCLDKILLNSETTGIRSLAVKLAYKQCKHYKELLEELQQILELMESSQMTAGLKHCRMKILGKL